MSSLAGPPPSHSMPLFAELRRRPRLLLLELAWRWACGSLLCALAGVAGWRIWTAALPQLRLMGVLSLTPNGFIEDPAQSLAMFGEAANLLRPAVDRAVLGLLPLSVFVWILAFAWGRAVVLCRFDPRLPHRPWLLAQAEMVRIGALFGIWGVCGLLAEAAYRRIDNGEPALFFLILLAAATVAALVYATPIRRTATVGTILALVENRSFSSVWRRAWSFHRLPAVQPLRKAVERVRLILGFAALMLAFVPDPVPFGPLLIAWWVLLTLPALAAADAWRLSAIFAVLRTMEAGDPKRKLN